MFYFTCNHGLSLLLYSLPLGLKTNCDSFRGFKTGLKTYLFRQDYNYSQCHSAPQITVTSLELWRFINYITYLLTYLLQT